MLLIDGLDALRGEVSQRAFRDLIRRVSREVPQCSVIASVRTFDLEQSEQLQQLFFSRWPGRAAARNFTQVAIPPFSERDLQAVVEQVPGLTSLVEHGSLEMRELLRTPFNLHIAASLLQSGVSPDVLSIFQSQVQLLDKYWRLRIEERADSADRKHFLRNILQEMVNRKSLSLPESVCDVAPNAVVLGLHSDEILRKGVTGRVSFSHNIIFDYASARLLLDEESLFQFVREDPTRTIFYRPTLSYFFRHLWVHDRDLFWKIALSFVGANDLPERVTIVPAIVIQEAASRLEDIAPLAGPASAARNKIVAGTLRAVQTLGGLQGDRRRLWLYVLDQLSNAPDLEFINEFLALLSIASETAASDERTLIGEIASRILRWIWDTASKLDKNQAMSLSDIGAARIFPIVMRFAAAIRNDARDIVRELLDRLALPTAGSHEAFWLAREIAHTVDLDPELAAEVYERAFAHQETSEETTSMGGSVVLTLTSTRRQDFSSALYGLQTGFNHFLDVAPIHASSAATRSVEAEIRREQPIDPQEEGAFQFSYAEVNATYVSDHSEIWDSGYRKYNSISLLQASLRRAADKLKENRDDPTARSMLLSVVGNASCAIVWKYFVETAALNISEMYKSVVPLLVVPSFIAAPEVTVAVGNTLTAAYGANVVSNADADAIETAIAEVPNAQLILRYEKPESIRNRLLKCIPLEQLRSPELKALSSSLEAEAVRRNEPFFRTSFSAGQFTTEDWLREQGVDTETPEHSNILNALKPLREFENKYLNEIPSAEESERAEQALEDLQRLRDEAKLPDALDEQAIGTMCAVAESILKNEKLSISGSIVQLSKEIVLSGAKHWSPRYDPEYHDKFDTPGWGSPSPRIEAAQGLGHFIWNWGLDVDVTSAFGGLSTDKVPAVRYQVASFLPGFYKHGAIEQFWSVIAQMLRDEGTTGVMLAILGALGRVAVSEPKRVVEALSPVIERGLPPTERHELTHELLAILAGLFIARGELSANELLLHLRATLLDFIER